MVKIGLYVPPGHLEQVKQALFEAGAGTIGNYEHCCWQTLGLGQFRPGQDSSPFVGSREKLETLAEYRVEMICDKRFVREAIEALRRAHPYEEPAYDVCELLDY